MTLKTRLQDQSATSALGSIIRGPTIRDGSSMLSLAHATSDDSGTVMDEARVLRLLCILLSFDENVYKTDPTPLNFTCLSEYT